MAVVNVIDCGDEQFILQGLERFLRIGGKLVPLHLQLYVVWDVSPTVLILSCLGIHEAFHAINKAAGRETA
jgi:hypothetical protein